jgi:hypothetical protein
MIERNISWTFIGVHTELRYLTAIYYDFSGYELLSKLTFFKHFLVLFQYSELSLAL